MKELLERLNFILENESRRQKDMKEVGQFPDIADYMRLYNQIDKLANETEEQRRRDRINRLQKTGKTNA